MFIATPAFRLEGHAGRSSVTALTVIGTTGAYDFEAERMSASLPGFRRQVDVAWLADLHPGRFIHAGSVAA